MPQRENIPVVRPQQKFSVAIKGDAYQKIINDTLGDKQAALTFIADVTTLVANNASLQECDPKTILAAALLAQSLKLPLAPTLGYTYIIGYDNTKKDANGNKYKVKEATFQAGWKGWVQWAIRSGQYEKLGVKVVHKGEVVGQDEFGDEIIKFDHKYDDEPVVGYYAYFKLVTGFSKTLYWSKEQCERHARKYAPEYRLYGTGKWKDMFDEMALKTVIKQLISKWGITSVELQKMIQADQAVIRDDGSFDYIENKEVDDEPVTTNVSNTIPDVDDNGVVVDKE